MDTKNVGAVKQLDATGSGTLIFASLNRPDKDGDILVAGAVGEQHCALVGAHNWTEVPIGKARVYETATEARADFQFNLDTRLGKNWYEAIKFDLDHPPARQQYSYGFTPTVFDFGELDGRKVRRLIKVDVHEVSPVLLGAGTNTRTLSLKDRPSASGTIPFDPARIQKRLEQTRALLLEQHFLEFQKARSEIGYREIYCDVDHFDTCYLLAREAGAALGIKPPAAIKFFREATWKEQPDFTSTGCRGQADEVKHEIYLRVDLGGSNLVTTIAHEMRHLSQPRSRDHEGQQKDEAEAQEFGEQFASRFGSIASRAKLYAHYGQARFDAYETHSSALPGSHLINFQNNWLYQRDRNYGWQKLRRWKDGDGK